MYRSIYLQFKQLFHSVVKCIEISQLLHNGVSYFKVKNSLQRLLLQLLYLSGKLAILVTSNARGSLKLKYIRQSSIIDILFVLDSFIKKRLTAKSKELMSNFFRRQASVPYIKIGRHLLFLFIYLFIWLL